MRIPRTAPTFSEIISKIGVERTGEVVMKVPLLPDLKSYVHWDKLIRYPPPEGLTTEEWWLALKWERITNLRAVPFKDKQGVEFRFTLPDSAIEMLHKIDMRAGGTISMPEQILAPNVKDRYYVSSVMEEAITSSQIEGATTTRPVAKEMIRSGRAPRDRSERMILNNYHTMLLVEQLRHQALSKELVFELHQRITDQTLEEVTSAGRFRTDSERIEVGDEYGNVHHRPPNARELDHRMAQMCAFANANTPSYFMHPVIRSIILHFWLAYDHPFVDGNGRTARALFYWSMARHGYWLVEFISISTIIRKARAEYERAFLYTETDENDLTYFILYHLELIHDAIEELHKYITRKTRELRDVERELGNLGMFNLRQRALLGHALRHPGAKYTIQGHQFSHGVVHQTARTDLNELKEKRLFTAERIGKRWYYSPTSHLAESLEGISRGASRQLLLREREND